MNSGQDLFMDILDSLEEWEVIVTADIYANNASEFCDVTYAFALVKDNETDDLTVMDIERWEEELFLEENESSPRYTLLKKYLIARLNPAKEQAISGFEISDEELKRNRTKYKVLDILVLLSKADDPEFVYALPHEVAMCLEDPFQVVGVRYFVRYEDCEDGVQCTLIDKSS